MGIVLEFVASWLSLAEITHLQPDLTYRDDVLGRQLIRAEEPENHKYYMEEVHQDRRPHVS